VQKLIPDFKGDEVEIGKKNCPVVVGGAYENAETAECAKTQFSEDKRQRGIMNPGPNTTHRN